MNVLNFEYFEPLFLIPFVFGVFGFIKKAFKKVKNVVGGALSFVPGGSIIKTGLRTAEQGIGAIAREIRGRKNIPTQTQFGAQTQPQGFNQLSKSSTILGVNKNTAFALVGVAIVGFIVLSARRR